MKDIKFAIYENANRGHPEPSQRKKEYKFVREQEDKLEPLKDTFMENTQCPISSLHSSRLLLHGNSGPLAGYISPSLFGQGGFNGKTQCSIKKNPRSRLRRLAPLGPDTDQTAEGTGKTDDAVVEVGEADGGGGDSKISQV